MMAVLVRGSGLTTVATSCKVCGTVVVNVPTSQTPVLGLYAPRLGFDDTSVSPAGKRSFTRTPVAVFGPALVKVIVNVIVSPTLGVLSLTVFVKARSACWGVSLALAALLVVLGSNWSVAEMVAVFVLAAGESTREVR